MGIDRTPLTPGNSSTSVNKTWENTFKNKINNIVNNVVHTDMLWGYIYNLQLEYVSGHQVKILPGLCRSDDELTNIKLTSEVTLSMNTSGVNGVDVGSQSAPVWYYVYVIKHSNGTVNGLLSLSPTDPVLPSDYIYKRLVGAFYNSGTNSIRNFYTYGNSNYREFLWDSEFTVVSGLNANGFQTIDVTTIIPTAITKWGLYSGYNRGGAAASGGTQPTWNISSPDCVGLTHPSQINVTYRGSSHAAHGDNNVAGWVPCNAAGNIQARRDDSNGSPTFNVYSLGFALEL